VEPTRARRSHLLLLLAGLVCPGCLILDPTNFPDPENELPTILATEPATTDVQFVDRTSNESVEFSVLVYDANAEDVLDARAFLDPSLPVGFTAPSIEVAPRGDPRERLVAARFPPRAFVRGCHIVEIAVNDQGPTGWVAQSQSDVYEGVGKVTAAWFVLAHDDDGYDDITLASCPGADPGGQGQ